MDTGVVRAGQVGGQAAKGQGEVVMDGTKCEERETGVADVGRLTDVHVDARTVNVQGVEWVELVEYARAQGDWCLCVGLCDCSDCSSR